MKIQRFLQLWSLLLLVSLCWASFGFAQDKEEEHEGFRTTFTNTFDGYIENETATRLRELDYITQIKNNFRLKYESDFSDRVNLRLDALALYDAAYDVNKDLAFPDDDEYRTNFQLREALLSLSFEKFDLLLGRQQAVWEVTDGLRVLDIVNPMDLRYFILKDFDLVRIPLWMANFEYYFNFDYSLQALIIPDMSFTELAKSGSEWAVNTPQPGVQLIVNSAEEPEVSLENTKYGLKVKGFYGGWDFTLNYLYTWDNLPVQKQTLDQNAGTLTISPEYERMHLVGGSVVNVLWDTVFRAELASYIGQHYSVNDPAVPDMVVKKSTMFYAIALERDLLSISWIAQGSQNVILDYEDAIVDNRIDTIATLRVSKYINDEETLELILFGMYRADDSDYLIRPYFEYRMSDSWRLTGGIDIFGGGDEYSSFGQFDEKDRLYAELKYSF
ncbi:MAG: hypothetical protein GY801_50285 [bacterium]|nr:hypothetical protein [bacterium]